MISLDYLDESFAIGFIIRLSVLVFLAVDSVVVL